MKEHPANITEASSNPNWSWIPNPRLWISTLVSQTVQHWTNGVWKTGRWCMLHTMLRSSEPNFETFLNAALKVLQVWCSHCRLQGSSRQEWQFNPWDSVGAALLSSMPSWEKNIRVRGRCLSLNGARRDRNSQGRFAACCGTARLHQHQHLSWTC